MWLTLHFLLFFTTLEHTTVLITSMMLSSEPLWIATLEIVVLRTRLTVPVRGGLITTITGGVLVSQGGNSPAGCADASRARAVAEPAGRARADRRPRG